MPHLTWGSQQGASIAWPCGSGLPCCGRCCSAWPRSSLVLLLFQLWPPCSHTAGPELTAAAETRVQTRCRPSCEMGALVSEAVLSASGLGPSPEWAEAQHASRGSLPTGLPPRGSGRWGRSSTLVLWSPLRTRKGASVSSLRCVDGTEPHSESGGNTLRSHRVPELPVRPRLAGHC